MNARAKITFLPTKQVIELILSNGHTTRSRIVQFKLDTTPFSALCFKAIRVQLFKLDCASFLHLIPVGLVRRITLSCTCWNRHRSHNRTNHTLQRSTIVNATPMDDFIVWQALFLYSLSSLSISLLFFSWFAVMKQTLRLSDSADSLLEPQIEHTWRLQPYKRLQSREMSLRSDIEY